MFEKDQTVVPKESSWFGSEAPPHEDLRNDHVQTPLQVGNTSIIPMHQQPLYTEDWIGLRALDDNGGVVFKSCPGEHMQLDDCWEDLVRSYIGGPRRIHMYMQ